MLVLVLVLADAPVTGRDLIALLPGDCCLGGLDVLEVLATSSRDVMEYAVFPKASLESSPVIIELPLVTREELPSVRNFLSGTLFPLRRKSSEAKT